jgi:hypothetical protein
MHPACILLLLPAQADGSGLDSLKGEVRSLRARLEHAPPPSDAAAPLPASAVGDGADNTLLLAELHAALTKLKADVAGLLALPGVSTLVAAAGAAGSSTVHSVSGTASAAPSSRSTRTLWQPEVTRRSPPLGTGASSCSITSLQSSRRK